ncbi:hypothetical protein EII22_07010 [Coriobacteriales bacterium OH1046]|nr:hypothetical protein EII22_07010 [Coriobacteriales bacterium OH1046]
MRLYLCGKSALSVLRYLRSIRDDRLEETSVRVRTLVQPMHTPRHVEELSGSAEWMLGHAGETIHALVPKKGMVIARGGLATHLWSTKVPGGAFIRLTDDLFLSSPAFVFLQMARELEPIELAKLGMELCGFYALPEKHTPYVPASVDETEYEIQAVASARKIVSLCEAASSAVPGMRKARMVAGWLADGAASPMESATYLLLCLPKRMGGYGLPKPVFNPKVTVDTPNGAEDRFPDLFWKMKDNAIDIEYQSDLAHSGNWKRYKDSKRQVQLTVNRITVLPLTKAQLKNTDDFHELAIGLHKLLKIRVRCLEVAWEAKRTELRKAMFSSDC